MLLKEIYHRIFGPHFEIKMLFERRSQSNQEVLLELKCYLKENYYGIKGLHFEIKHNLNKKLLSD
jgi:hypothetical protein